ncbi:MAG: AraC family transcriptional regulator [Balneolaceae bacterium]|nr:AraC family transcriptional regulator [Balneolaceae bacterium]MBO6547853.1 AraC family transcriptional regulator [Balneolaceae bacterium]MBO6648366.1 AraC family transcriptional regulator [Balneolaceae bacterium]
MDYREFKPDLSIQHLVECFWTNYLTEEDIHDDFDLIIPDGNTEAMIMIDGTYLRKDEQVNTEYLVKDCRLVTPFKKAVKVFQKPGTSGICIRFKPGAITELTGYSLKELDESAYPLEVLMPDLTDLCMNEVHKGTSKKEIIQKITRLLRSINSKGHSSNLLTHHFIQSTIKAKGNILIEYFCEKTGVHKSTLEKNFNHETGLTPKQYSRIIRYNYLMNQFIFSDKTLTQISLDSGYYDQSHMIKDFTSFTGLNPSQYKSMGFHIPKMMATSVTQKEAYY